MVKGISRQVIVVPSTREGLFEQAIFILKDSAREVSEEMLMKEAEKAIRGREPGKTPRSIHGAVWALGGAAVTGMAWLLTVVI